MRIVRFGTGVALAALGVVCARPVAAQSPDVSGTWALTVTTDQGVTQPTVTFRQEGARLTGEYASEALGRNRVRGSVAGSTVTWSFSAELQGQEIPVRYRGTLQEDGTMTGSIDIAGGMLTGSFTGVHEEGRGAGRSPPGAEGPR